MSGSLCCKPGMRSTRFASVLCHLLLWPGQPLSPAQWQLPRGLNALGFTLHKRKEHADSVLAIVMKLAVILVP